MSKREYIVANRKWLEDKAKEEGVEALPKGIYYKVLKSGDPNGAQPQKRSIVTILYRQQAQIHLEILRPLALAH